MFIIKKVKTAVISLVILNMAASAFAKLPQKFPQKLPETFVYGAVDFSSGATPFYQSQGFTFTNFIPIFGGSAEAGYGIGNFLMGLKYQGVGNKYKTYGKNKNVTLVQNFFTLQFSGYFKLKNNLLAFRPTLGWGADIISTSFTQTSDGQYYKYKGYAFCADAGFFIDFTKGDVIKPYFGGACYMCLDEGGIVFTPVVNAGIRISNN